MNTVKVKFCGLTRIEDIQYVNELMPDYIGFVFANSKRQVNEEQARELKRKLNPYINIVGVFVNEDSNKIIELLDKGIIDIAQLHGNESEEEIKNIKKKSGKKVIKAIKVKSSEDIKKWKNTIADHLLLDNGQGTGKTFDWSNVKEVNSNFFLAGGLTVDNVEEAIIKISPMAIDISSGIESNGVKDYIKMKKVIEIVKKVGRIYE